MLGAAAYVVVLATGDADMATGLGCIGSLLGLVCLAMFFLSLGWGAADEGTPWLLWPITQAALLVGAWQKSRAADTPPDDESL